MAAPGKDPNPTRLSVNEAAGSIAIDAVSVDAPNSIKMRRLADSSVPALDELPDFLTSGRAKCSVTEMVDDKGEPCLVIKVKSRIPHNKRPVPEAAAAAKTN